MRPVLLALVLLAAVLAMLAALVRLLEPKLIYFPARSLDASPAAVGLAAEDLGLAAADGTRLHGWFVPSRRAGPTVLFLHGNAGNISHRLEKITILHRLGAAVCIIDYRGYGRSDGAPGEAGLYLDARAAAAYLLDRRQVDPASLVVYGESLGTAVAVDLAAEIRVGGVVLEAAFTSVRDVARELYGWLPVGAVMASRFDSLAKLPRVRAPILLLHSRDDEFFGLHHAARLQRAATSPVRLVELQGGHNDAFLVSVDQYRQALDRFLSDVVSAAATPAG